MTRPTSPPIASRWCRNRWRAYDHWLRALSSRPASTVASRSPPRLGCANVPAGSSGGGSRPTGVCSVITDPRIEVPVEDVSDEVEHDDEHRRHHQIRHQRIDIELAELLDEVVADAVEREN